MRDQNDQNQETPSEKKKVKRQANAYLKYTSLAMQMVVTIGLAGFLGYWIDQKIGWRFPVFLMLFILLSLFGIIYGILKSSKDD